MYVVVSFQDGEATFSGIGRDGSQTRAGRAIARHRPPASLPTVVGGQCVMLLGVIGGGAPKCGSNLLNRRPQAPREVRLPGVVSGCCETTEIARKGDPVRLDHKYPPTRQFAHEKPKFEDHVVSGDV